MTQQCIYLELYQLQPCRCYKSTLECHTLLGRNIPSTTRESCSLSTNLNQTRSDSFLILFLPLPAGGIMRRNIRFADITQYPAMKSSSMFLLFFRSVWIWYIIGYHEFGCTWTANDMAAWFGYLALSVRRRIIQWMDVHIAFNPLVRVFLQLGHIRDIVPSEAFSSVKCTSTRDLRE